MKVTHLRQDVISKTSRMTTNQNKLTLIQQMSSGSLFLI